VEKHPWSIHENVDRKINLLGKTTILAQQFSQEILSEFPSKIRLQKMANKKFHFL